MNLTLKNVLGEGSYCKVFSIKESNDCVVKRNKRHRNIDFISNIRELDILHKFRNNIFFINMRQAIFDNCITCNSEDPYENLSNIDDVHFVLDRMDFSLKQFIYTNTINDYMSVVTNLMSQLLCGLSFLHKKGYIHRDIKPENILIQKTEQNGDTFMIAKMSDFGSTKPSNNLYTFTSNVTTHYYMAPEMVLKLDYDQNIDIWSMGCVFFEMIAKSIFIVVNRVESMIDDIWSCVSYINPDYLQPTREDIKLRKINKIKDKIIDSGLNINFNINSLTNLLEKMLNPDPDNRCSASEALNHPYFNNGNNINVFSNFLNFKDDIDTSLVIRGDSIERKWVVNHAKSAKINLKLNYNVLYHAMDIFDRYLANIPKTNDKITQLYGEYMTIEDTILTYYVCLYLSYKYFLPDKVEMLSWKDITHKASSIKTSNVTHYINLSTDDMKYKAKDKEKYIITEILKYDIYRETILEMFNLTNYNWKKEDVGDIYNMYININREYRGTHDKFFEKLIDKK